METPENLERARSIFDQASLLPADEREQFVWAQAENAELRVLVLDLLNNDTTVTIDLIREANQQAEQLVTEAWAGALRDAQSGDPKQVGSYRILSRIGEGASSTVYLARQSSPERDVAIKVLHHGVVSPARLSRFAQEAQITGNLKHPMIAHVYDAWTTLDAAGMSPYIVMENVNGCPISEHVEANHLTIDERVTLCTDVCSGLEHAHKRGIVHCDIKPANVLVDEHGKVKILDFGIAQLMSPEQGAGEGEERLRSLRGTPAYMSPEQLGDGSSGPDVRSDVYSLGVLLYELISGHLPYAEEQIDSAAIIDRIQRGAILGLGGLVDRDLEAIVMRALARDIDQRYQSVSELSDDLGRYLRREPVGARPANAVHRFRRFSQRNGALVTTAGVALVFLTASTILAVVFALGERDARIAEGIANELEIDQAIVSSAIIDLLIDELIEPLDPYSESFTTRGISLEEVIVSLNEELSLDPELSTMNPLKEAAIRTALGRTQSVLSENESAIMNFDRAINVYRNRLGDDNIQTLLTRAYRAVSLVGSDELELAYSEMVEIDQMVRAKLGEDHPRAEFVQIRLARLIPLVDQGRTLESAEILRRVLSQQQQRDGPGALNTLGTQYALAQVLSNSAHKLEARAVIDELLPLAMDNLGETHMLTLEARYIDAFLKITSTSVPKIELLTELRDLYDQHERIVGLEHNHTGQVGRLLAQALFRSGAIQEAETILLSILSQDLRTSNRIWTQLQLGEVYGRSGRFPECEQQLSSAHESAIANFGEHHAVTGQARSSYTAMFNASGRPQRTIELVEPNRDRHLESEVHHSLNLLHNLATAYAKVERYQDAKLCIEHVVEVRMRLLGPNHQATKNVLILLQQIEEILDADIQDQHPED